MGEGAAKQGAGVGVRLPSCATPPLRSRSRFLRIRAAAGPKNGQKRRPDDKAGHESTPRDANPPKA